MRLAKNSCDIPRRSASREVKPERSAASRAANASETFASSPPSPSGAFSPPAAGDATPPVANALSSPPFSMKRPGIRSIASKRIDFEREDPSSGMYASSSFIRSPTTRQVLGLTICATGSIGLRPPLAKCSRIPPLACGISPSAQGPGDLPGPFLKRMP